MYFAVMTQYSVKGLKTQVPSFSFAFNPVQELNALNAVHEISDIVSLAKFGQKSFAIMSKRRVADIMTKGYRLYKILV